ncbi:MAG: penicillin acylase family protein [Pseudomonadota bacterium]
MKKIVVRVAAFAALLLVVALVVAWLAVRGSLPNIDGEDQVAGLSSRATIERDASGIPVITASNRSDLAFATGYAHGQDRFFQMDLIRRQAAGELSALVGAAAVDVDKAYRFHRFRARAADVLAEASLVEVALLESYANGVNAGLNSLDSRPFEYFVLRSEPQPWHAEDSLLVVYAMFVQLNDSRARKEVRRGRAFGVLPRELYQWMYPSGTPWDAPLMGEARAVLPIPGPDVVSLRGIPDVAPPANEVGKAPLNGSNNWAVSGELTASGRALVSNDMHLGLSTPNIYYRARLVQTDNAPRDVTGVTLPGSPFVIAGSNTQIAWGYTNSYGDYTDAVLLRPGEREGTYRTSTGDREFEVYREVIEVKGGDAVAFEVRETIWGPVREDANYPDGEIAVSWIAHKPESVNLNLMQLETAASAAQALDIANTMGMPPQNFVTGDSGGNIGWTIAGKIPTKVGFDAQLPADWSDGAGWTGWVLPSDYPRIYNPESGRIWTANSRVVDGAALETIGDGSYDLGARTQQIRDALFARNTFTPADMLAIQYDDRAIFLAPWRELLLSVLSSDIASDDAELAEYRALVENWIPRAAPESVGYRLVRAFRLEVQQRLFYALTTPVREALGNDVNLRRSNQFEAALWAAVTEQPEHLLPADYDNWDAFFLTVVRANIDYFDQTFGGELADRRWGEVNTASIRHPLSGSLPLPAKWFDMPAEELNGDANLPKAQGPSFGASERFSVFPGDEAGSLLHMPTGQSGHPMSGFYRAGHDNWVKGRASPFLPGPAAYTLTLLPETS